jgi:hypothetical protein
LTTSLPDSLLSLQVIERPRSPRLRNIYFSTNALTSAKRPLKRPETYHGELRDCYFDTEDNRCSHSSPLPPVLDMIRLLTFRNGCRDIMPCITCSLRFHPTNKLIRKPGMLVEPTSGRFVTRRDLSHVLEEGCGNEPLLLVPDEGAQVPAQFIVSRIPNSHVYNYP